LVSFEVGSLVILSLVSFAACHVFVEHAFEADRGCCDLPERKNKRVGLKKLVDLVVGFTSLAHSQAGHCSQGIPLRLGVSKAILENVVFCHQEDASWP
ncbi:unnamed protein product, partial [Ectocarpus sp. 12 AP-2014]